MRQKKIVANWTPLHAACKEGNLDAVSHLLKEGGDVDVRAVASDGSTPFSVVVCNAVVHRDATQIMEKLLDAGADVNQTFKNARGQTWTALHAACFEGIMWMVKILLKFGADINIRARLRLNGNALDRDASPLHLAVRNSDEALGYYLLQHSSPSAEVHGSVLHEAVHADHEDLVRMMVASAIKAGADCELKDANGRTPLMRACGFSRKLSLESARVLLPHCNTPIKDSIGSRMLHVALTQKEDPEEVVRLLLEQGVSANAAWRGWPPLLIAIARQQGLAVIGLLAKGAHLSYHHAHLAVDMACWSDDLVLAKVLAENGGTVESVQCNANTNYKCSDLKSLKSALILWTAVLHGEWKVTEGLIGLLLSHGADLNWRDPVRRTLLHCVMANHDVDRRCVQLLLRYGAEVNTSNRWERTPLHVLSANPDVGPAAAEAAQLMLEHNAKVDHVDEEGATPLLEAVSKENVGVLEALLSHQTSQLALPQYN